MINWSGCCVSRSRVSGQRFATTNRDGEQEAFLNRPFTPPSRAGIHSAEHAVRYRSAVAAHPSQRQGMEFLPGDPAFQKLEAFLVHEACAAATLDKIARLGGGRRNSRSATLDIRET